MTRCCLKGEDDTVEENDEDNEADRVLEASIGGDFTYGEGDKAVADCLSANLLLG